MERTLLIGLLPDHLARWGFSTLVPHEKVIFLANIINALLTELVRSRWGSYSV